MRHAFLRFFSLLLIVLLCTLLLSSIGCSKGRGRAQEIAYVSAPQAILRDHVAAVYQKTGVVKNGERLEVLEREKRFVRVRTAGGTEGWIEQRYLVSQSVYDGFQALLKQVQNDPVQATGSTRNDTNLHLEPGRETEHLFQLNSGSKVSVLKRATAEKNPSATPVKAVVTKGELGKTPTPILEDWWLIRDPTGNVGWVLARMIDLDVPLEIAQYAEGQRLVAFFVLNQVTDGDKKVPQYLVLMTEPKDGMPFDYNQVRVFTWNVRKHRYETAYREHGLNGILPVTVSQENFDKEGNLPVFVLRVNDENGNITERKYKMNTPIVKRVLAPGEQKEAPAVRRRRGLR
ncbi:MAG TPA: SH3 domain-containing protein [Terriglobales bacterium]|nr:SH3 domain-containing protein [Terriglobales bacterium]